MQKIKGFTEGHRKEGQHNSIVINSHNSCWQQKILKEFGSVCDQIAQVRQFEAALYVYLEEQDPKYVRTEWVQKLLI